jgi:hypothetical protein
MDLYQIVTIKFINKSDSLITTNLCLVNDLDLSEINKVIIGKESNQFLSGEGLYGSFITKFESCKKFNFSFYSDIPNHEIELLTYKSPEDYVYNLAIEIIYQDYNENRPPITICDGDIEYSD